MMSPLTTSPTTTPRLQQILDFLDRQAQAQGIAVPQIVDIQKLRTLPQGTFGRAWADLLDANNLQPFTTGSRRKQLHDGIHVLTGYGTDLIGEAQVQAFVLGTKFRLTNLMLGLGLLRAIHKHHGSQQQLNWHSLWQAYQRGVHSHFDPDAWEPERLWNFSVADVQALFAVSKVFNHQ
jgi:ubiquinone biosynthesis protein COQ4